MARPASCTIARRTNNRGMSYALRVSHNGTRHWVPLGASWEGWNDERAEAERSLVATLLERGEWEPTPAAAPRPSATPACRHTGSLPRGGRGRGAALAALAVRSGRRMRPATDTSAPVPR